MSYVKLFVSILVYFAVPAMLPVLIMAAYQLIFHGAYDWPTYRMIGEELIVPYALASFACAIKGAIALIRPKRSLTSQDAA